ILTPLKTSTIRYNRSDIDDLSGIRLGLTMYEHFYGLRERPFDLTPNPRYLFLTNRHREALGNLEYGIAARKGITVLTGEAGTGKTTLVRTALARAQSRQQQVVTRWAHLKNSTM